MAARVCHLSYEFWPHIYGGLGRAVTQLTTALVRHGWHVDVATLGHPASAQPAALSGVSLHRVEGVPAIGGEHHWRSAVAAFDAALLAVAEPLTADADVLHVHDWFAVETALELQRRYRLPLVVTVHATERGRHQGWLPDSLSHFVDSQERRLADSADRIIVCSAWMRAAIVQWWEIPAESVTVIPNGTTPSRAATADSDRHGVLFAGRCEHEKGGQVLLAALDVLRREGVKAGATIAGEGSQRAAWQRLATQLGLEDVTFSGHLDDAALAAAYGRAAVVAVPSLYEPFGLVAAEALAAGTAVVASATGGLEATVGDGGILVPPEDPQALAAALLPLLTQSSARTAAQARARQRAAWLPSWDEVAAQTAQLYAELDTRTRRTLAD